MRPRIMCDVPPEYAGTKVGSTRTTRDIFTTKQDIDDFIKNQVEEALKKDREKRAGKAKLIIRLVFLFLILAPVFTYTVEMLIRDALK